MIEDMCEQCHEQEADAYLGGQSVCWDCFDELREDNLDAPDEDAPDEDDICEYCGQFIDEDGDCLCEKEM